MNRRGDPPTDTLPRSKGDGDMPVKVSRYRYKIRQRSLPALLQPRTATPAAHRSYGG